MEIKSKLKLNGSSEVNAVLLNDAGEEYPVFLQSLHNKVIFAELMASGYKLDKLPYGFVKDGVHFDNLPVMEYSVDNNVMERMYYTMGDKMDNDEMRKYISVEEAQTLPIPPTKYTINTREEFLHYLETIQKVKSDSDFMPLNYFVSPVAQFTIEEFESAQYGTYAQIIQQRRRMSLDKFNKLIAWLNAQGVLRDNSLLGVIDAYLAWGFDGVRYTAYNRSRSESSSQLIMSRVDPPQLMKATIGLVDRYNNLFLSDEDKKYEWKSAYTSPEFRDVLAQSCAEDEAKPISLVSPTTQTLITWDCVDGSFVYNEYIFCNKKSRRVYSLLSVMSPTDSSIDLNMNLALPSNYELMKNEAILNSIAKLFIELRKVNADVSSFKTLQLCGLDPIMAVTYILSKSNAIIHGEASERVAKAMKVQIEAGTLGESDKDDGGLLPVESGDVNNFMMGRYPQLNDMDAYQNYKHEQYMSIISGEYNLDSIASGEEIESTQGFQSVYEALYAAHHVFKIPVDEIYREVLRVCNEQRPELVFTNGTVKIKINAKRIDYKLNGYPNDTRKYTVQSANKSTWFTYVTQVAREVGTPDAHKHVGIEFYFVYTEKKHVKEVLEWLRNLYYTELDNNIANEAARNEYKANVNVFAMTHYFEAALQGICTLPNFLGRRVIPIPMDIRNKAMAGMERKLESTLQYVSNAVYINDAKIDFNGYCVNAFITADQVIPRKGYTIKEVPFYTLWTDWRRVNPAVWQALLNCGAIDANFVPWDNRYSNEHMFPDNLMDKYAADKLYGYYNYAVKEVAEWPKDVPFVSVKHPFDLKYDWDYDKDSEDAEETNYVPGCPAPNVKLGAWRNITSEDFSEVYAPSIIETPVKIMKRFVGFSVEALMNVPDVFSRVPKMNLSKPLLAAASKDSIITADTKQTFHCSRVQELMNAGYPITHVYDRTYLFRAMNGDVWEVTV